MPEPDSSQTGLGLLLLKSGFEATCWVVVAAFAGFYVGFFYQILKGSV